MTNILLINTGGTIASVPGPDGLAPGTEPGCLSFNLPLGSGPSGDSLDLFALDSTDIRPAHWLAIADVIRENYGRYDGFVITHGTDTLSFTAAGLSALIENSRKPVVLTGAQLPAFRKDSDGPGNVRDAYTYASSPEAFGVHVVFAGHVIDGMRVRKIKTNSFECMVSVNAPDDAYFKNGGLFINKGRSDSKQTDSDSDQTVFHRSVNENICILRLYPGICREIVEYAYNTSDGLVLETFGCGGIPEYVHFEEIVRHAKQTIPVIICTQVMYEGTDLARYEVGQRLLSLPGIREGGLMTAEAAYAYLTTELAD